jgi:hypothetical protein
MSSKLTLRLDEDLIRFGKGWARRHGKSLSGVLADYLKVLERLPETEPEELPPMTRELLGSLKDVDESDYYRYLERKHS